MVILATHPGARIVGIVRPRRVKSVDAMRCDAACTEARDGRRRPNRNGGVRIHSLVILSPYIHSKKSTMTTTSSKRNPSIRDKKVYDIYNINIFTPCLKVYILLIIDLVMCVFVHVLRYTKFTSILVYVYITHI